MPLLSALTVALFAFTVPAAAQQSDDLAGDIGFLLDHLSTADDIGAPGPEGPFLPDDEVSDAPILARFMIRVYQAFVSSQQHNVCVFAPSCSHFGMESVQRLGFVGGVLLTADRLARCNALVSRGGYAFDQTSGKFADPAAAYFADTTETVSCTSSCGRSLP